MRLKYRNYTHPAGTVAVAITQQGLFTPAQHWWATRHVWQITATITGSSAATVDTAVREMQSAYSVQGGDLLLLLPDGTPSTHQLLNASCHGGTRVMGGSFPDGRGAEGVTYRTVQVTVEGDVPLSTANLASQLMSFSESVQTSGGGPRFGHLESVTGRPQKQRLRRFTTVRAVQSGQAVGLYAYPTVPTPIWPGQQVEQAQIRRQTPKRVGSDQIEYPVTWSYRFESSFPLIGTPNVWGVSYIA